MVDIDALCASAKLITLDADEIVENLWQGGYPRYPDQVKASGFSMLVMCAGELQDPASDYPGVELLYAPNSDDYVCKIPRDLLKIAVDAGKTVAQAVKDGRKVLVTCAAGINRSGLVSALALHFLYGWPGTECIKQVKAKRVNQAYDMVALDNPRFREVLLKLKGAKPKPLPSGWIQNDSGLILPK